MILVGSRECHPSVGDKGKQSMMHDELELKSRAPIVFFVGFVG